MKKRKGTDVMGEDAFKNSRVMAKNYVRIEEGAELYSLGMDTFRRLAEEGGAIYKIGKIVLVNTELFEKNLENYRIWG
jgi:hypothetical protein